MSGEKTSTTWTTRYRIAFELVATNKGLLGQGDIAQAEPPTADDLMRILSVEGEDILARLVLAKVAAYGSVRILDAVPVAEVGTAYGVDHDLRVAVSALPSAHLTAADVELIAALLQLGPPGGAVAAAPRVSGDMTEEKGDAPGERAIRARTNAEARARSAADHAFREVAYMLGKPLPSPHRASPPPASPTAGKGAAR